MKRRDFLKGILSTPVAAVGIAKAAKDISVLKASPKPSEVETTEELAKAKREEEEYLENPEISGTYSASPSESLLSCYGYYYSYGALDCSVECEYTEACKQLCKAKMKGKK